MSFMESMSTNSIPVVAAFFIGLMSAISPCTLATNISATAYLSREIGNTKKILLTGILYTLGRVITYTVIAAAIVYIGLNEQVVALLLQEYADWFMGLILVFSGLVMFGVIKHSWIRLPQPPKEIGFRFMDGSYLGALMLGIFFALAFCPFSAVLYFGLMIPIALKTGDALIIPASFAIATGVPAIFFSFISALCAQKIGETMRMIRLIEYLMRKLSALVFIVVGVYYIIKALFPGAI